MHQHLAYSGLRLLSRAAEPFRIQVLDGTTVMRATLFGQWYRLVSYGFELLYNQLAGLYDTVSWVVSRGMWRRWQKTAWAYLPSEGRILDVGCGPGHLLADLVADNFQSVGLDLSPAMLRLAQKGWPDKQSPAPLCRGRAKALPFAADSFAAVISSFPTAYVYDPDWLSEVQRLLKTRGRLIVIEAVSLRSRSLPSQCLEWLYRVSGERRPRPDLVSILNDSGLPAWRDGVRVNGTVVSVVLARKPVVGNSDGI
jgi:SAM-dependent methyltransferase